MKTTINFNGEEVELDIRASLYTSNNRPALYAVSVENDELFGTLTTNIPEALLSRGEVIINTYSENEDWVPQVLENLSEHFTRQKRTISTGFITLPIYKVSPELLATVDEED